MKTIRFCKMGSDNNTELGTYRARTVFRNDDGHLIFIEYGTMIHDTKNDTRPATMHLDFLFDITVSEDCNISRIPHSFGYNLEATKENLLMILASVGGHYDNIEVLDSMEDYRADYDKAQDDFIPNRQRTAARNKLFNKVQAEAEATGERFPCICIRRRLDEGLYLSHHNTYTFYHVPY